MTMKEEFNEIDHKVGCFRQMIDGVWLSIAVCFMLFLYAPLELLFTNQEEFWFDVYILVPIMSVVFLIACVVCVLVFLLIRKLSEKLYQIALMLYFIIFIGLYAQGNFLAAGLPSLDGEPIDWNLYTDERVKSIALWVAVAVVIVVAFWKLRSEHFHNLVRLSSIGMTLMLSVTLLTLVLTEHGFQRKPSMSVTTKNMFQMSEDTNFVVLLLDAVDAQVMESMLETDPGYQDIFTDFTFYDNVMAAYPYTQHSIPYILSGKWYENETEFGEYEAEAYASSQFFAILEEAGYRMGFYEADLLLDDASMGRFDNILPNERGVKDQWAFARWQILMTGFKYAPYDLKRFSFVNPNAFSTLKITPEGETLFTPSNVELYDGILHEKIDLTAQKCFRFIHVDGGHVPFIYNENVEEIPEEQGTYEDNLKACLTITRTYLDKLKERNVYDNSVILVMADHGYNWLDPHGRQNPILFVKGIGERHEFQISDAPISFEDLQESYERLLSGADSTQIFDWKSGDERERRYLFHEYLKEDHMVEYMQPGQAHDTEAMYETGKVYDR